jgi:hypothetical protein
MTLVLAWWQFVRPMWMALAAAGTLALALPEASAQGKLEAHYIVTLAGIPIGKGSWTVDIADTQYSASVSGVTTGLMHVLTNGEGTTEAHGTLKGGRVVSAVYAATVKSYKKTDDVRLSLANGEVKEVRIDPPPDQERERVKVSEADLHDVFDPMTASLLATPGTGNAVSAEACQRTLPVFDGRLRYDLKLAFKRMDMVKAEKGYAGPVVVCAVYFTPLSGYIPTRATVRYLAKLREMEIWLAPVAGTRVLVPFRAQGPTPIGEAVMEATQFVTAASPSSGRKGP